MPDHSNSLSCELKKHNLAPQKKWGQNFLSDTNLLKKIVSFADIKPEDTVIEVGPGPGKLTSLIIEQNPKLYFAIEKDQRFVDFLKLVNPIFHDSFRPGDALKTDISNWGEAPRKIIANLPYNIATKLLINWLMNIHEFSSLTLMFQKEVVDRMTASPQTKNYGRLALATQYVTHVKKCMTIAPNLFYPPPKVDSAVVHLSPKKHRYYEDKITYVEFQKTVKTAFQFRRKMLRANFKNVGPKSEMMFEYAQINSQKRAEDLSLEEFCHLTYAYQQVIGV